MSSTPDPTDDHEGLLDRLDDFKDRVEEAAIQAEFETGEREETVEEAKANALVRVARMTLGFVVVIIGIIALPLPGPGWLIIAAGLTILSKDVAWADRLLRYIRKRVPGIPEDGKIPRSSLVTMALITLAAVSASLWWTFARGSDEIQTGTYTVTESLALDDSAPVIDPGIELVITSEGPVTVTISGCDPVDIEVTDRSKTRFELGDAGTSCDSEAAAAVIQQLTSTGIDLNHSTDGIVNWFFADDDLTEIVADGDDGGLQLTVQASTS